MAYWFGQDIGQGDGNTTMLANMLLTFSRQIQRQTLYTVINMVGLAFGIATFLTLTLIVRYETAFDAAMPHERQIYRLDMTYALAGRAPVEQSYVSFVPYPFLRQDFPAISSAVRVLSNPMSVQVGEQLQTERVTLTDPDFFAVFALPIIAGSRNGALDGPNRVILPASIARKYFGTVQAVGRQMDIDHGHTPYVVSAVYADLPPNSTTDFGIIATFPSSIFTTLPFQNWGSNWGEIWVRIDDKAAVPGMAAALHSYIGRHPGHLSPDERKQYGPGSGITLVALPDVHFHDAAISGSGTSRQLVTILGLVGIAALATATVNYINLATARAGLRAREVAMRKVLGASQPMLAAQFMAEALAMVALSALAGLAIVEVGLNWINALSGWAVRLDEVEVAPLLAIIIVVVGLAAGLYPALVLSSFRPAQVLASSRVQAGGRLGSAVRNGLVVLQFSFAIVLAICTLVMTDQAAFIRHADRGLHQDGVIVINALDDTSLRLRQADIVERLRQVPGVLAATRSDMFPHHLIDTDEFHRSGSSQNFSMNWGNATPEYFETYRLRLLAGRLFDAAHGGDYSHDPRGATTTRNIVISRVAARDFGFATPDDAVGQVINESMNAQPYRVIGVIDDVRFAGVHETIQPLVYFGTDRPINDVAAGIRYAGISESAAMARLHAAWRAIAPDVPFDAVSVRDIFADDYRADWNHGMLFAAGSTVAILIACLGLYGLSSFNVSRRMQEIGIRKVMGAQTGDILGLLIVQFVRPVMLASLIAWPVAWIAMRAWLSSFDQRIALTPTVFLLVAASACTIAVVTVIGQTLRVARAAPAQAIRAQ
jgi:putative ABC transport system permease protein